MIQQIHICIDMTCDYYQVKYCLYLCIRSCVNRYKLDLTGSNRICVPFFFIQKINDDCLNQHRCKCNHKHIQFIALPRTTSIPSISCIGVFVRSQSYFSFYTVRIYSRHRHLNFSYFL